MTDPFAPYAGPAIVLVEPQLGENIGTTARAMANFGLGDLRIVNPREGWPNDKARAAASGAPLIDRARIFATLEEAVGGLHFIYATTARERDLAKPVTGPREAGAALHALHAAGIGTGVLFGRERNGLTNDELSCADEILTLPVDPAFSSLNIAQAVLIIGYEWRQAGLSGAGAGLPFLGPDETTLAAKESLVRMFEHLERALEVTGFFRPPEKRPHTVRALRTMLHRARFSEQEVRTFRGVIAALERRQTRLREAMDGSMTTERGEET